MKKLNFMAIGAHPDDCDFQFGGTALKLKKLGHRVMFLTTTNGCSGHHLTPGPAMSARRYGEIKAVEKLTGIEYRMTDIPDCSLTSDLRYRDMIMREIRAFKPDVILSHRPNDYHPDHRATGTLVMDCSYLCIVPHVVPDSPPLKSAPYIFYFHDRFTFPGPFMPDVVVSIDDVMDKKTGIADCHVSQVYEFLPWAGKYAKDVPPANDPKGRFQWLKKHLGKRGELVSEKYRDILIKHYGKEKGAKIKSSEAFQLGEYGAQMDKKEIARLFPM